MWKEYLVPLIVVLSSILMRQQIWLRVPLWMELEMLFMVA